MSQMLCDMRNVVLNYTGSVTMAAVVNDMRFVRKLETLVSQDNAKAAFSYNIIESINYCGQYERNIEHYSHNMCKNFNFEVNLKITCAFYLSSRPALAVKVFKSVYYH